MQQFNPKDYWEKRLQENWGLRGVGYIGYGKYYNQWLYKIREKVFNHHIRKLTLGLNSFEKLKILDIGSGTGFYLGLWKSIGVKLITGSDITSIAVEHLKKLYPELSIVHLDIGNSLETQDFSKNKFDVITAFDVCFHIIDDFAFRQALFNISRLLKPGGYFLFSDNFLHGKTIRSMHQVSRSIEDISGILKEAGFRPIKKVPMFVLMNTPVDTRGNWPSLLWRVLMSPVRVFNLLGFFYGAALFPVELFLCRILKESPSTEMMICRKVEQS